MLFRIYIHNHNHNTRTHLDDSFSENIIWFGLIIDVEFYAISLYD